MLKKTIVYENPFTNQEVTEEHYFHISKADLVEMEMEEHRETYEKDGETLTGMRAKLQKIIDAQDGKAIMSELKDIIRRSYGVKDGDRFIKNATIWENFSSTEAFSQLLFDLCTNADAASEFINGIAPANLEKIAAEVREQAEKAMAEQKNTGATAIVAEAPTGLEGDPTGLTEKTTPRVLSIAEAQKLDAEDLKAGLADGRYKLS